MGWPNRPLFTAFLIVAAAIHGAHGIVTVSGIVFCDQCKDGHISLFDYPLYGIKVSMACPGEDGQLTMVREETTNWLGCYVMRFDDTPDMSGCVAQVSGSGQDGSMACGAAAGPARNLKLVFRFFDMEVYTVDPLLSQPAQPKSYCPRSTFPVPAPVTPAFPPPFKLPSVPQLPPVPPVSRPAPLPPVSRPAPLPPMLPVPQLPPLPPLPPMPRVPFLEASACPFQTWTMPEHQCYWKVLAPDMKVAVVFGPVAARRYGTDITLWGSMRGKGNPYRTLLREGTTALLNSYNSIHFPYHPLDVVLRLNGALMGSSTKQVLLTALRFMRSNSGSNGNITCRFTPCK